MNDDFSYTATGGMATIIKYDGKSKNVTIPSKIDGFKVSAIGKCAFKLSTIESIKIPEGVVYINDQAFYSCENLKSITFPKSIESIGVSAFGSCISLTNIVLPDKLKIIFDSAFADCNKLSDITFNKYIENIRPLAFTNTGLHSLNLPDSITKISYDAFFNCKQLISVKLPKNLNSIEGETFRECSRLQEVVLPENLKQIDCFAFSSCSSLSKIVLNNGLRFINDFAFSGCPIKEINIPPSVKCFGYMPFKKDTIIRIIGKNDSVYNDCKKYGYNIKKNVSDLSVLFSNISQNIEKF